MVTAELAAELTSVRVPPVPLKLPAEPSVMSGAVTCKLELISSNTVSGIENSPDPAETLKIVAAALSTRRLVATPFTFNATEPDAVTLRGLPETTMLPALSPSPVNGKSAVIAMLPAVAEMSAAMLTSPAAPTVKSNKGDGGNTF